MINRRILAGALGTFLFAFNGTLSLAQDRSLATLSVEDAHQQTLDRSITLIDIRRPDEWSRTGSAEGAHRLDMRRQDFGRALFDILGSDPAAPVALICASGVRSAYLAEILSEVGFTNVIDVPEGMMGSAAGPGWLQKGLPVTR